MKRHSMFLGVCCFALACGGSSGDPKSAAMFVGEWMASSQTGQSAQCGTQTASIPLWGKVNVSLTAPNSGEIVTQADNGCTLTWSCEGNTATLLPNSTCNVVLTGGGSWDATFTKGTLTLGSNEITLDDNGTALYEVNGATQNCTFQQSGSFTDSSS
jgi:hypothetical protein